MKNKLSFLKLKNKFVEKYPIDVELRGNFIDFGNFLDQLAFTNYYLTISNIQISQNPSAEGEQKFSFISYIYTKIKTFKSVIIKTIRISKFFQLC